MAYAFRRLCPIGCSFDLKMKSKKFTFSKRKTELKRMNVLWMVRGEANSARLTIIMAKNAVPKAKWESNRCHNKRSKLNSNKNDSIDENKRKKRWFNFHRDLLKISNYQHHLDSFECLQVKAMLRLFIISVQSAIKRNNGEWRTKW